MKNAQYKANRYDRFLKDMDRMFQEIDRRRLEKHKANRKPLMIRRATA